MKCLHPIPVSGIKKNGKFYKVFAPCGKCEFCLSKKRSQWVFRLSEHFAHCDSAVFVTLTYQDSSVPYFINSGTDRFPHFIPIVTDRLDSTSTIDYIAGVYKRDVQLFLKKLRKRLYPFKFSYFCCSEYGPNTGRPHYHLILFDIPKFIDVYEYIDTCWNKGYISISDVNPSRINYVCKYCINPLSSDLVRPKTFMLCSKGLGRSYSDDPSNVAYHRNGNRPFIQKGDNIIPLPRYLKEKIFSYDELDKISEDYYFQSIKELCREHVKVSKMSDRERDNYFNNSYSITEDLRNKIRKSIKGMI